ncbi:GFA family protein [Anianabacter salinae]|uniref:GFA family protein n=1 Tax=Anianabacter salinae TaxID=2851023 RepID=UPI00225DE144|nr:GFA family protein [Anianabacter salinae]MBV0913346.1 GFA family protein [Anianabacter salinae]
MTHEIKGGCLCGGVRFTLAGPLTEASACHCGQCRRSSGHHWASVHMPRAAYDFAADETLRWYDSSPGVRRGFCGTCGAFLFWDKADEDAMSVSMGALDTPTGTRLARHIFVSGKGDYYDIADGLPQTD